MLAPDAIIRRGHRRQARTAVGGVLAGVVAIAIAVGGGGQHPAVRRRHARRHERPAGARDAHRRRARDRPGRMDADRRHAAAERDLDVHAVVFVQRQRDGRSTQNGSPVAGSGPAPEPSSDCTSAPADLPAGVPVPAARELRAAPHGVGVRLGRRIGGILAGRRRGDLRRRVPVRDGIVDVARRLSGQPTVHVRTARTPTPSAWRRATTPSELTMAADRGRRPGCVGRRPRGRSVLLRPADLRPDEPVRRPRPPRVAPAYVLAAGGTAQEGWRLEAGIKSFAADGSRCPRRSS